MVREWTVTLLAIQAVNEVVQTHKEEGSKREEGEHHTHTHTRGSKEDADKKESARNKQERGQREQ